MHLRELQRSNRFCSPRPEPWKLPDALILYDESTRRSTLMSTQFPRESPSRAKILKPQRSDYVNTHIRLIISNF